MKSDISQRLAREETGYALYALNGLTPPLTGHELPPATSVRWKDSCFVQLDSSKSAEELAVEAITEIGLAPLTSASRPDQVSEKLACCRQASYGRSRGPHFASVTVSI